MSPYETAMIVHEVNRAYCLSLGDRSQLPWGEAPLWQRESAIKGVMFVLDNPSSTPADQHEQWMKLKLDEGWKYGPKKNIDKKEHPCLVPYEKLPQEQRSKDYIFRGVVNALKPK